MKNSRAGHHIEHPAHAKHQGHKKAHEAHESARHATMKRQVEHGRGVHAHGPDYGKTGGSVSDNHQQGIARKMMKKEEMEVGQGGKMSWKGKGM